MFELRRLDASLAIFEFRDACRIERDVGERVGIAIQFAAHVLDGEILQLAREFRRALVQWLQVRAFHFVAALHLPDEKLGIAPDSQRVNVVSGSVIKRGEKRIILCDVIRFATDIFRQLQDNFP